MLQIGASNEAVIERKIVRAAQYVRMSTEHHKYSVTTDGNPALAGLGGHRDVSSLCTVSHACRPACAAAP